MRSRCLVAGVLAALAFTGNQLVHAVDTSWKAAVSPDNWFTASNWTNGVPTAGSANNAYIQNGGTAAISGGSPAVGSLYIDNGGVAQSAATFNVGSYSVGYNANTTGTYTLSGTGAIQASDGIVGLNGTGNFMQTGGSNQAMFLTVGYLSAGNSIYQLDAGTVKVTHNLVVGNSGTGTFIQNGGTVTLGTGDQGSNWLGQTAGSSGTYQLQGGTLITLSTMFIGDSGSGHFIHSGGTHQIADIDFPRQTTGSGIYELSNTGILQVKFIDYSRGAGRFIQTGGTNTVNNYVQVSGFQGSTPTYEISGGTLTSPVLNVARNDFFNEAGKLTITGGAASITVGTYAQAPLGTLLTTLDSTGLTSIDATGAATLSGIWQVVDAGAPAGFYDVINAPGGISGVFNQVVLPDGTWSWGKSSTQVWLVHDVPETTTLFLLLPGTLALLARRKPKRRC